MDSVLEQRFQDLIEHMGTLNDSARIELHNNLDSISGGGFSENVLAQTLRLGRMGELPDGVIDDVANRIAYGAQAILAGQTPGVMTSDLQGIIDGIVAEVEFNVELHVASPGSAYHDGLVGLQAFLDDEAISRMMLPDISPEEAENLMERQQNPNVTLAPDELAMLNVFAEHARALPAQELLDRHEAQGHRWVERDENGAMTTYDKTSVGQFNVGDAVPAAPDSSTAPIIPSLNN